MNAQEAFQLSMRGCENIAEQQIKLATEKGHVECSLDHGVYEGSKDWILENGYRVIGWIYGPGGYSGVTISWDPLADPCTPCVS